MPINARSARLPQDPAAPSASASSRTPVPTPEELEEILTIGTRVPDHGKFVPWRLILIEGEARVRAGEKAGRDRQKRKPPRARRGRPRYSSESQFLPAPVTVGVLLSPKPNPKAPEMEQLLSAGNVCFNLSHAAFALGFAASWTNRWYGFDTEAQTMLGARGGERFVGFVHIGTPTTAMEDRDRPNLEEVVTRWQVSDPSGHFLPTTTVTPAKAGAHPDRIELVLDVSGWIPAFAGMTSR
jgi:nitroreductase